LRFKNCFILPTKAIVLFLFLIFLPRFPYFLWQYNLIYHQMNEFNTKQYWIIINGLASSPLKCHTLFQFRLSIMNLLKFFLFYFIFLIQLVNGEKKKRFWGQKSFFICRKCNHKHQREREIWSLVGKKESWCNIISSLVINMEIVWVVLI